MKLDLQKKYQAVTVSWESMQMSLEQLLSFWDKTLLYFYPKDNTPGCTLENKDFSCLLHEFKQLGIVLIWVSKDSIESHRKFITDHDLQIDLISDPDLELHRALEAYGEKNNYGKIVMGVIRSTFLLDKKGNILHQWKNIKATGHAQRILKELQE